jgi:integrase
MAKPLTELAIQKLKPRATRYEAPDGRVHGLFLIIQPSNARSWAVRYRFQGKPTKHTLGTYPALDLPTARNLALKALGEVAGGKDPHGEKLAQRAAMKARAASTDDLVENICAEFISKYASKHTRDWRETERLLAKNVIPSWAGRRIGDIQKKDVVRLMDQIAERGPVTANRTYAQIRKMINWAISRSIVESNPCTGITRAPEIERERVLDPSEIGLVWRAAPELSGPYRAIVQMLILTGQRRDEVAGLQWSELDMKAGTWTLPAARSKNRREHVIPLTKEAAQIIDHQPRIEGVPYVFTTGRLQPQGFSIAKRRLDQAIAHLNGAKPIAPWVLHDLRRTVASGLAELGIQPHIIEAVLNHRSGIIRGVARVYNRFQYEPEKRKALEAWAARLDEIVTGKVPPSNVVSLSRA